MVAPDFRSDCWLLVLTTVLISYKEYGSVPLQCSALDRSALQREAAVLIYEPLQGHPQKSTYRVKRSPGRCLSLLSLHQTCCESRIRIVLGLREPKGSPLLRQRKLSMTLEGGYHHLSSMTLDSSLHNPSTLPFLFVHYIPNSGALPILLPTN